jgi:sulfide:quinone oxidoreductase
MMANKLNHRLPKGWQITLVDRDDVHLYQPGLVFLPFGMTRRDEIIKPRRRFVPPGVDLHLDGFTAVEPDQNRVLLGSGDYLAYDLLIVATGTEIHPEETPGLAEGGWHENTFDFYTLEGAEAVAERFNGLQGGKVAVHFTEMPIKCPVAPLEFVFLADAYFRDRGIRDKIELSFVTPLDGAFTKPKAAAALGDMLTSKDINVVTDYAVSEVDGVGGKMLAHDGRAVDFDVLVTVPVHKGADAILRSAMGDSMGFVPTDKHTLQAKKFENVFVLGDATDVPTSKAGSVAHFQAEVLLPNVLAYIAGRPLRPDFDGHANCFIETGHDKAILIDFNYETEPLPGKFPLPGIGPFSLLKESYINHWGKLSFQWIYWQFLLRGRELPVEHRMSMTGKWS